MSHYHNYYAAKLIFLIGNTNKNEMFLMFLFRCEVFTIHFYRL